MHVRPPPGSDAPLVLESDTVEIEIEDDLPVWIDAPLETPHAARDGRPKAKASSVHRHAARSAVDGNPRSPWLAAADDDEPRLRVTYRRGLRANLLRVTPGHLVPRSPPFLTAPTEISVRVNRGERHVLRPGPEPHRRFELRLDEPVVVKNVELRILAREVEDKAVGVGEVELLLTNE